MTPSQLWLAIMMLERQAEDSQRLPPGTHMIPNTPTDMSVDVDKRSEDSEGGP